MKCKSGRKESVKDHLYVSGHPKKYFDIREVDDERMKMTVKEYEGMNKELQVK